MTYGESIMAAFTAGEILTNEEIGDRTGFGSQIVATYTKRLRDSGLLERATNVHRPMRHRLAGAARARAEMIAAASVLKMPEHSESIVGRARRTQPVSVFELGRFAC